MKIRFVAALMVAVGLSVSTLASAQQYKQLTRLGGAQSICKGGVQTLEELQQYFAANPDAVRAIAANARWAGSAEDLLAAIARGDVTETSYPKGTKLAWMGARTNGVYEALPYREWAGNTPFEAFRVDVSTDCQVSHIAIPKACCNIALISVEPDTSEACAPPPAPEPEKEPAVIPAPPKEILGLAPFFGIFAGTETRPRFEPAWEMDMRDSSGIVGIRAGLMKGLTERTSVFGQLSYYDRNGINEPNIYPEDNLAIDVGLDYRLGQAKKAFIGGGIGVWNIDDSDFSDASLFAHVGADIGKSNFQWFLEARIFDSDSENLDSISNNRMFSGGIRYIVK